jgi:3-hydroxyacyl-CoA dehydrogenase
VIFRKVAVIGAGLMGHGIAVVAAQTTDCQVYLNDIKQEFVDKGMLQIKKYLDKLVDKNEISPAQAEQVFSRIHPVVDLREAITDADLVVEAVTENRDVKESVLAQISQIVKPSAYIVSNTSSIPISELAPAIVQPERFAGMHFFNPPQTMKLVEVIQGVKTSDKTVEAIIGFTKAMGKEPVTVKRDTAGFIVNRIFILALNEAVSMAEAGVATPEDIDKAIKLGLNWPMGPLALLDYIGEDTVLSICEVLEKELGPKYSPSMLLKKMVTQGLLGRKTGQGFYNWTEKPK